MINKLTLRAFALALMVGFSGCDLDVTNTNEPDRDRALATADDVETLIASSYQQIWSMQHYWNNNLSHNMMSHRHTASWGNMGQNDFGREPREPMPNQSSYYWSYVFEGNWQDSYAAISAASDGIRAIEAGLEIGPGGERNPRATVFAKFNVGMARCYLGMWYDKAFIVDETTDVTSGLEFSSHDAVMTAALAKLSEVITEANATPFTLQEEWMPSTNGALSNTDLAKLATSYRARCRANGPRSEAEAASVDWSAVKTDATNGLQELTIVGTDADTWGTPAKPWWDGPKALGTEPNTWHRMHPDWHGMSDVSGNYQAWINTPLAQRVPFAGTTPDIRYPDEAVEADRGTRHEYKSSIIWPPVRGTYRQSHYADFRHEAYMLSCTYCYFGNITELTPYEMRLMVGEGALRTGDIATAVAVVNETRVGEGGLPAVTDAGTVPGGANCVPRKRYDPAGRCGYLRDAMIYEHFESVFMDSGGLEFLHGRRHDILPTGTAIHLPVPASDLEVLQYDLYTFGGAGNPGSAGNPTPPNIVPGSLDSALERAAWSLGAIQRRAEARAAQLDLVVR